MKKIIWAIVISAVFSSCASLNVKHIDSNTSLTKKSGFFYNLPKTLVSVDVSVNKVYKIKGPYSVYADKFLGLKSIILTNTSYYEINDIKLNSYSKPDADQYYFIETGNNGKSSIPLQIQLSEAGFLVGANYTGTDDNEQNQNSGEISNFSVDDDINANFSVNSNLTEKIDTVIEKVNLDTITIEKKILKKVMVEKTLEQKAKEAADFIMSVKEAKFNLLNGMNEVTYSKEAIAYMVEQLDKTEAEYMNLFTGITATQTFHYYFTYCPEYSEYGSGKLLGKFSVSEGVLDSSRFIGKDIVLQVTPSLDTKKIDKFISDNYNAKRKKHGFYYRIPEYAEITVKVNNVEYTKSQFLINQFGVISEMPYSKGMQLNLFPKSGALKMMKSK